MIKIPLTQGKFALIDECDAHLQKWKWYASYDPGTKTHYALTSRIADGKYKSVKLHHMVIGKPPKGMVTDHINGDTLDNRRDNLRFVTNRENLSKRRDRTEGKTSSRFIGVSWHKGAKKWSAEIFCHGKKVFLGQYSLEADAGEAYRKALHAIKNFPKDVVVVPGALRNSIEKSAA